MSLPKVLIVTTEAPDVSSGGLGFFHKIFWRELKKVNYPFISLYLNTQKTKPSVLADHQLNVEEGLPFDSCIESSAMNKAWTTRAHIQHILDAYKPDIISVHENWSVLPFYFELDKVQFTLHASYMGMQHYLVRSQAGLQYYWEQRIALRQAKAVVMHSEWTRDMAVQHITEDGVKPDVFPIGLDFSEYPSEKIFHPEGKLVVSFFGRFGDVVKNLKVFCQAIFLLPPEVRNKVEARIYGPDKLPKGLDTAGFYGLRFVQGDEKRQAFAETNIVVMPSSHESFGIVGLEALLSNCALIGTPGIGMDAYMPAEFACVPTPQAISERLIQYVKNADELRKKQQEGYFRKLVEQPQFEAKTMTRRYIDVWMRAASSAQH